MTSISIFKKKWKTSTGAPILVVLLFFLLCPVSTAQEFRGGLKGGMTASEVSGDHLASPDKIGYFAAAFTNYPISRYESIQFEVMYIHKGSRSWPDETNDYFDYRFALQYVELPVLFVQDLSRYTSLNYLENILAYSGLSASFLVDHQETEGLSPIPDEKRENYHGIELNFLVGLSYPMTETLFVNLGYSNSLTPVRPHASGNTTWYNYGQYNSVWSLGLSYYIW